MSQPPLFGFSNITQITWEITASLVDKYERRTTRTASTFVLAYPYGLPRRLFPTPFALSPEDCRKTWELGPQRETQKRDTFPFPRGNLGMVAGGLAGYVGPDLRAVAMKGSAGD